MCIYYEFGITLLIAIAPPLGGLINQLIGWRGNYWVVAILCLVSWIFITWFLPETKHQLQKLKLKSVLKNYRNLFSHKNFLYASLVPSLLYSGYLTFVVSAPFLYMQSLKLSMVAYVSHQTSIITVFSLVSLTSNKIVAKFGKEESSLKGIMLCLLSSVCLTCISLAASYSPNLITLCMLTFCIGFAICYPILFTLSLNYFPEVKGTVSSAIMSTRALLTSLFVGMAGYSYNGDPIRISLLIICASGIGALLTFNLWKAGQFKAHFSYK